MRGTTCDALIVARGITSVTLGDEEYLALARPMRRVGVATTALERAPVVLVLRSRTERLRFLNTLRAALPARCIVDVLLATILSYAVARTMTRPLAAVTGAMRDVAATGDLTRKVHAAQPRLGRRGRAAARPRRSTR